MPRPHTPEEEREEEAVARLHPPCPAAVTGLYARPGGVAGRAGIGGAGGVCENNVKAPQISFVEPVMWGVGARVCEQEINLTRYETVNQ